MSTVIEKVRNQYKYMAKNISSSTGITKDREHILHGNNIDSSEMHKETAKFVSDVIEEFVEKHWKEIREEAAKNCLKEIEETP